MLSLLLLTSLLCSFASAQLTNAEVKETDENTKFKDQKQIQGFEEEDKGKDENKEKKKSKL